ncbi:MAG: GCN5-related N-acetyltransferase [Tepidiformaceae bacterium]
MLPSWSHGTPREQFRAERLYRRLGWNFCGVIPGYALNPDRMSCDTTVYWKSLT